VEPARVKALKMTGNTMKEIMAATDHQIE